MMHERGIDMSHETVRYWVDRFGSKFATGNSQEEGGSTLNYDGNGTWIRKDQ